MRYSIRPFLKAKFFLISVVAILLFCLAGFVLVPHLIQWYVPKYVQDLLKCQASMGKVRLNPFLLRFEVNDFNLNGPDGALLVSFSKLYLDYDMTGLFRWAIHFNDIRLEKPSVNLVVEPDGSLNFAALAPKSTEEKPKTSESRHLGFILGTLAITGGEVALTDRRQPTPAILTFQDIDLELKALTTLTDKNGTYSLKTETLDGETIDWRGQLSLMPFQSNGKIIFSNIRTASFWKFLQNNLNIEEPKGLLGVSADYQLSAAQSSLHLTLENFMADLSGVSLKLKSAQTPFFELNRFGIDSAHFDLSSRKLKIKRFLIDGGMLHIGIDEAGQSNLEKVIRGKLTSKETSPAVSDAGVQPAPFEGQPLMVSLEAFEIKDMTLDMEDLSRSLPMAAGISNISIRSRVNIEAGLQTQAAVKDIVTEFKGVHFGIKAAPKPLFAAQRLFLEGGNLNLGEHKFSAAIIGLSQGQIDIGVDQQGNVNWEQILASRKKDAAVKLPLTESALSPSATNLEGLPPAQPAQAGSQSQAIAQPVSSGKTPWKVDIETVDIKDMALGLEDISRSSPVSGGVADISIRFKAGIEAGHNPKIAISQIATELKKLHIGVKGAPKPLFLAQRLVMDGGDVDLGAKVVTIERIYLNDGHIDVGRNRDGKINWEELFAGKIETQERAGSKPASGHSSAWKFLLKSFELDNFRSEVMDQTVLAEKPLNRLMDIKVRLSEIDAKSPMKFEVGFGLEKGGKAALRGKVNPVLPSVEANVNLAGVDLTVLQPYIDSLIILTLDSATISTDGVFRFGQPGAGSKLSYDGSLEVEKLNLNQPGSKETYIGWGGMKIPKIKLLMEPNRLQIDEIRLFRPVGEVVITEDGTLNLAKIVKKQSGAVGAKTPSTLQLKKDVAPKNQARTTAEPANSEDSFAFSIGRVKIEDGNMVFADLSLKPKFMTRIHDLKGTVGRLSSEKKSLSEIQLNGRVDQYGMVNISGAIDINDFKQSTDIAVIFRNVEMANISPYSGRFAGRRIESGKLSLDLKYQIQTSKLVGDNKIIVDNLVLGEKVDSPDAVNLPLDLAVALLADSNGRIDLGLPVSGELDDPKFSIGPIIWKAFVNIITKAVTAPFRALGSLLGGVGAEKFDAVEFYPGKAELLPPEKEKLKKVAEAMQKRPQLKLVIQGQYSPDIDGQELKQNNVSRAVVVRMGVKPKPDDEPIDFGDSKVRAAIEKLFVERFGSKAMDELKRAVKQGEIKPRAAQEETDADRKKRKGFDRLWGSMKLYRIVPGAMSPEQTDLLTGEMFARLVESHPSPDDELSQLAANRAQAIMAELQKASAVPADRLQLADVQPLADESGVSAKLSLASVVP